MFALKIKNTNFYKIATAVFERCILLAVLGNTQMHCIDKPIITLVNLLLVIYESYRLLCNFGRKISKELKQQFLDTVVMACDVTCQTQRSYGDRQNALEISSCPMRYYAIFFKINTLIYKLRLPCQFLLRRIAVLYMNVTNKYTCIPCVHISMVTGWK